MRGAKWIALIDVQYFAAQRSGSGQSSNEINIGAAVFPIGSTVSAEVKNQYLSADYRYSFVKTDKVEAAGLLGFYSAQVEHNITVTGNPGGTAKTVSSTATTDMPLPLIGLTLDWYIDQRWKISGNVEGFKLKIGDVDGQVFVARASAEFMLVRNFGVGVRYLYSDFNADVTKSDFNGTLSWKMNSVALYGKLMF